MKKEFNWVRRAALDIASSEKHGKRNPDHYPCGWGWIGTLAIEEINRQTLSAKRKREVSRG